MLKNKFILFSFKKNIKNGLFADYLFRIFAKTKILNVFIWSFLYVGEKFIIEYTTRFSTNFYKKSLFIKNKTIFLIQIIVNWLLLILLTLYI